MRQGYQIDVSIKQVRGHSILLWLFLSCCGIGIPWLIYYSISPNHYWHI